MNCKPGDLAIVVRAPAGASIAVGSLVKAVELLHGDICLHIGDTGSTYSASDAWRVEYRGSLVSPCGRLWTVTDSRLRPIRDNDSEDEILRIAGKPINTKEPA
jgi:hypothetical protein